MLTRLPDREKKITGSGKYYGARIANRLISNLMFVLKSFNACNKSGQSCLLRRAQAFDCQGRRKPAPFLVRIWHALQNIHPKSPKAQDYFGYPNRRSDGRLCSLYPDIPGDPV